MAATRILFVDDEPGIRATMPAILQTYGFAVTVCSRVDEALAAITSTSFDVLISDLNIGQPGDGFVVVSAMRRTQPNCLTIILTGFPGFETALHAIRSQVDDYLIKPTPIPNLLKLIEEKLTKRQPSKVAASKRVAEILRENTFEITQRALAEMKADPLLSKLALRDEERIEHLPGALQQLAAMLESTDKMPQTAIHAAQASGAKRYRLGYTVLLLAAHVRATQCAIYEVIHENLLSLNLSYFLFDLKRLNDSIWRQFEHTLIGYLQAEQSGAPQRETGQDS